MAKGATLTVGEGDHVKLDLQNILAAEYGVSSQKVGSVALLRIPVSAVKHECAYLHQLNVIEVTKRHPRDGR